MNQITFFVFDSLPVKINGYGEYLSSLDWGLVATVVAAGVGIVLAVLVLFIFIFGGFGNLVSKMEDMRKRKSRKEKIVSLDDEITLIPMQQAGSVPAAPAALPIAEQEQGISGEIIAAITAAVAASEGGSGFVIRSVKRKNISSRNPWAMAAVSENTRPF